MAAIETIRREFDPLAHQIAAHITLVFPFASDFSTRKLRDHVANAIAGCSAFAVSYAGIRKAENEYVFLDLAAGREQVTDLHHRLYSGPLRQFLATSPFVPHTTVARTSDPDRLDAALRAASNVDLEFTARVAAITSYEIGGERRRIEFRVGLAG